MEKGKNFKGWGVSYGIVGDLVMGLPVLTYMEKKWPGSYKYWIIEKKVAITAPLYLNHPLIDCIRITGEWGGFSAEDYKIASTCEFKCTMDNWKHDEPDWFNRRGQVEETARIAGIYDLKEWLSEEEMMPKLYQWFDVGVEKNVNTYSKENLIRFMIKDKSIAVWPFATSAKDKPGRNPSVEWWSRLYHQLTHMGYSVLQFGYKDDPVITSLQESYNNLTFFEQVKIALACKMSIGTDSGNMWVMGAYNHPAIHLMTNWLPGHTSNMMALEPSNKNGKPHFAPIGEGGVNAIPQQLILEDIERMMV